MGDLGQTRDQVGEVCRSSFVFMLGPEKGRFLHDLVEERKPSLVVECGTAIGYSGLWILAALKRNGAGRLITVEIDPKRAQKAERNFARAGTADRVDVLVGDAGELLRSLRQPVDFLFLDNDYGNYWPCFRAVEPHLVDGTIILADNAGVGAFAMARYLDHVRTYFESRTERFHTDLPWMQRDAMEVTVYRKRRAKAATGCSSPAR